MASTSSLLILLMGLLLSGCTMPLVWESTPEPIPGTQTPPPGPSATSPGDLVVTQASTPSPTSTVPPTPSPTILVPTPLTTPTPEQYQFVLQAGSPQGVSNFTHAELGCDWMGVGGQIFGMNGQPNGRLVIEFGGQLAGTGFKELILAGSAESTLGPGGFEFTLADSPIASQKSVWAQVFDLEGVPLSAKVFFDTFDDCERNLIILNFVELPRREAIRSFLPGVPKSVISDR